MAGAETNTPVAIAQDESNFDLVDTADEIKDAGEVGELLTKCRNLGEYFHETNVSAGRHLTAHRALTCLVAFCGAIAILFAIHQLGPLKFPPKEISTILEYTCAAIASAAVVAGLIVALDHRWRQQRFRAEASRFVKFNYLLNGGRLFTESGETTLEEMIQGLRDLPLKSPRDWVRRDLPALDLIRARPDTISAQLVDPLVEYYRLKRIDRQYDYFLVQEEQRHFWERILKRITEICFAISLLAALSHFWHKIFVMKGWLDENYAVQIVCLYIAAGAPVIAAAIRTYRSAHEFGRNTNRYHALRKWLGALRVKLDRAETPEEKLNVMWQVEQALEYEHHSWQRLMLEAEWFG